MRLQAFRHDCVLKGTLLANGKLFVTGYYWGGGQSFRFATNRKDLKAAFVFCGPPPRQGLDEAHHRAGL
jgi:carboxymethylenebutenolidase